MQKAFISIIIPALNEQRFIGRTFKAIGALQYPHESYEVILVDNGSTDDTMKIASTAGAKVISSNKRGVSSSRNIGAREAAGSILAFLDADCVPEPDWLEQAVRSVSAERCITGAEYGVPQDAGWIEKAWFIQGSITRGKVTHVNAGNMIVAKDLFNSIGGFDETLVSGEDYEFCARALSVHQIPTIADSSIRVIHLGNPKTLYKLFQREIWHGLGALGSFRLHWFDKPFLATIMFLTGSLLQAVGLLFLICRRSPELFFCGTAVVLFTIAATVFYRRRSLSGILHALQLALLYYIYFLGRSVALLYLLCGRRDYLRKK